MTTSHHHADLTGPATDEARRRITTFTAAAHTAPTGLPSPPYSAASAGFTGIVITDAARLKRLMQRRDPHVYPGTYSTCVFDPAKAMCQPRPDSSGTNRPAQAACQPLDCRNTALTTANRTALRAEADQISVQLDQRPSLPPMLIHRLIDRRDKITTFLTRHEPAEEPGRSRPSPKPTSAPPSKHCTARPTPQDAAPAFSQWHNASACPTPACAAGSRPSALKLHSAAPHQRGRPNSTAPRSHTYARTTPDSAATTTTSRPTWSLRRSDLHPSLR